MLQARPASAFSPLPNLPTRKWYITQVNQTINAHQGYTIDLNNDGIVDFRIQNMFNRQFAFGFPYASDIGLMVVPADGVQAGSSQYEVAALPSGANIGPLHPTKPWGLRGAAMAYQFRDGSFGTYYFGSWLNASDRYLGLAFHIDGETHYGWARLTVHWNGKWILSADITGYAYETIPNKPITAGDTGGTKAGNGNSGSTGEMFVTSQPEPELATLGALSLGSGGLAMWRRP